MANTKISALTAATTPLAGTEVLPIVQGGVTKKVSVADLTTGRAVSALSLTLTNALTAANGGTGQSSYSVGDLLYANDTTSLSKLADVATGNALISGGVNVAPLWGKIGLTTHVSGTLPVANGGTGITSLGAGIATWLGTPSSANLAAAVTDETGSGSLVFGTSPSFSGLVTFSGSGPNGINIAADTGTTVNSERLFFSNATSAYAMNNANGVFTIYSGSSAGGSTGTGRFYINSGGQVGVATTSTAGTFNVDGDVYLFSQTSGTGSTLVYNTGTGKVSFSTSSLRYKKNIRASKYGLSDVMMLQSVLYETKDSDITELGFIAEKVNEIIPEVVGKDKQGQPEYINYERLVSVLAAAIQDLKLEFDAYKNAHL